MFNWFSLQVVCGLRMFVWNSLNVSVVSELEDGNWYMQGMACWLVIWECGEILLWELLCFDVSFFT